MLATLRRSGTPHQLTPTRLYKDLVLTSGAMTHRLDALERAQLVERQPDPEDRRGTLIGLTTKGHAVVDRAMDAHLAGEAAIAAHLSKAEQKVLSKLLKKLLVGMEKKMGGTNRVVVIGGGSGMGLEGARTALADSSEVVIAGRSEERLRAARRPMRGGAAAAAINSGLEGLVRALAVELAPLRVNAVSPGWTDTTICSQCRAMELSQLACRWKCQRPGGQTSPRPGRLSDRSAELADLGQPASSVNVILQRFTNSRGTNHADRRRRLHGRT